MTNFFIIVHYYFANSSTERILDLVVKVTSKYVFLMTILKGKKILITHIGRGDPSLRGLLYLRDVVASVKPDSLVAVFVLSLFP